MRVESETELDATARVAALALHVPRALICIIDGARESPRGGYGLAWAGRSWDARVTPPAIVADVSLDPRFAGHPLIQAGFYAAAPLITSGGAVIGSLAVMDDQPRADLAIDLLEALAAQVIIVLELENKAEALQTKLLESEKMASLGHLFAGVAHEMNTPIGAVRSNAIVSGRALEIIRTAFSSEPNAAILQSQPRLERALATLKEANDVEVEASERIAVLARSLRMFARSDEPEKTSVDLHEGIDSTLTLLRHELKDRIEVEKHFGALPPVACHASQINQVFMNLLVNAAQAIDGTGTIRITTRAEGDFAVLAFSDTGRGIAAADLAKIFAAGFTTKTAGTGLGLSISAKIVRDHGGTITVASDPAGGTTFTVRLPIH